MVESPYEVAVWDREDAEEIAQKLTSNGVRAKVQAAFAPGEFRVDVSLDEATYYFLAEQGKLL